MKLKSHWHHAILTFALTVLAAGVLLPFVRVHPESVHKYFNGLNRWIGISFSFSLCVVFTGTMFKLLTPRLGHLAHWWSYPPAWLAAALAWILVAIVDVLGGFDTDSYRATVWEWLGYGGGSLLLVGWYSGLWLETVQRFRKPENVEAEATECVTLQDIQNAPWEEIEAWLESDAPARYDFLGNQSVAHRVSFRVSEGTRSVGIVGSYGAGKTSIVSWITDRLKRHEIGGRKFFVCHHSCWGYETSASAIQNILGSAVLKLSTEIDTFQVDSLPESYRQAFSAGGDWVATISNLVLRNPDPMEQFSRLSDLLGDIDGRLVFIVEDLDRNETRNFEIQEVLAFLERLKKQANFSFILTGGLSSSQCIDYAKLCDDIEFLKTIQPHQSSGLIERLSQRCLDNTVFPHVRLSDPNLDFEWDYLGNLLKRDFEEFSLAQSVATLLNTPRSLRHAIGRTSSAWRILHGEIDFHHLLAVNILRFGAPECFQFLIRRWDRLHSPPNQSPAFGQARVEGIRQAILDDWNRTIQNVEWNPTAALQIMKFILPATKYWLVDNTHNGHTQSGQQHVSEERYWIRAINEAIDEHDVRDQKVIRDIKAWMDSSGTSTELISKLTKSAQYADLFENFASYFIRTDRDDEILLLCKQVIQHILAEQCSSASEDSQGFIHILRLARRTDICEENSSWLECRISEAAKCSLQMTNALWGYFGSPNESFILRKDLEKIRLHMFDSVKECVSDSHSLIARLHANSSSTLFRLVFDPEHNQLGYLADAKSWKWLGPMILDGVRKKNLAVTSNCVALLGISGRDSKTVDTEVLDQFFAENAREVIDLIESTIDQIPEDYRMTAKNVVEAARRHFSEGSSQLEPESVADND